MTSIIPISQQHESLIPSFQPVYNWITITPNQTRSMTTLHKESASDPIEFDLSGDNCINLSKSYLEFTLTVVTDGTGVVDPIVLDNTFNFNTIKVHNRTGTLLCDLDINYNQFRDLMDELSRKFPDDIKESTELSTSFDGLHLNNKYQIANKLIDNTANTTTTILCRYHFNHFYNTILAYQNDIFFGESILIQFTWGGFSNMFSCASAGFLDHIATVVVTDPKLYVCYNKDPTCNKNTINYVTHNPIDFTDFNIVRETKNKSTTSERFNYNFTINSSIGPYLKYIIYRAYESDGKTPIIFNDNTDRFRWMINDFVYTPDYLYVKNYESYQQMYHLVKGSFYDKCNTAAYYQKFFEILNFTSGQLNELKMRAGRPLSTDIKVTMDAYCKNFTGNNGGVVYHRFFVITGKMLYINEKGVEKVV